MDINRALKKIEDYKKSQEEIVLRRTAWNESTQALLSTTLKELKAKGGLDMQVQDFKLGDNFNFVNIMFNKSHSGLVVRLANSTEVKVKKGGALIFSQAYNGDVFVVITYPSVEDHIPEKDPKQIDRIAPEKITKEYIYRQFCKFMDEMTMWERGLPNMQKIGFKTGE